MRNSIGFDFQPGTGEFYFTDNDTDMMGDNSPPDEFNHVPGPGLWFGFPYYGGGRHRTTDFRGCKVPRPVTFPVVDSNAHVAALGISFYRGSMFPPGLRGDAFVAEHGSWNRTIPDGYRVMRVRFDKKNKKTLGKEIFAEGWLVGEESWDRPVDIKELGALYRITYPG